MSMKPAAAFLVAAALTGCSFDHAANTGEPAKSSTSSGAASPSTPSSPSSLPTPEPQALTSLTLTVPATLVQSLSAAVSATAEDASGNSYDVTAQVVWTTSDDSVVGIDGAGRITAVGPGTAEVDAAIGDLTASATITVTAPKIVTFAIVPGSQSLPLGSLAQFSVTAAYDDGSVHDLSQIATWSSSDTSVATPDAISGDFDTLALGTVTIAADAAGLHAEASLTVDNPGLASILVVPGVPHSYDQPNQLTAMGTYTDGTTLDLTAMVQWTSMDSAMAALDPTSPGVIKATRAGSVMVQAAMGNVTGQAQVYFEPKLVGLVVDAGGTTLAVGDCHDLHSFFRYDDGSTESTDFLASYSGDNNAVATVDGDANTVCGNAPGTITVTATVGASTASTTITVQ
jgi:trimeric autotransporter adhesin